MHCMDVLLKLRSDVYMIYQYNGRSFHVGLYLYFGVLVILILEKCAC